MRTDPTAVQNILGIDWDGATDVTPYIDTMTLLVDDLVAYGAANGITVTSARAEMIERWASAHGYGLSDQPYSSRSTSNASGSFQGQTGMYWEATKYGQMALLLDPTGFLKAQTKPKFVGSHWGGTLAQDQTTYEQRNGVRSF